MPAPISIFDINPEKININTPDKTKSNIGKLATFTYDGRKLPVDTQMPEMTTPFGASIFSAVKGDPSDSDKISVLFSFAGSDEDTERGRRLKRAEDKCRAINERIKALCLKNKGLCDKKGSLGEDFFNDRDKFRPFMSVRQQRDGTLSNPEIRAEIRRNRDDPNKIDYIKGKQSLLVDVDNKPVEADASTITDVLPSGSVVKPIIRLSYVYINALGTLLTVKSAFVHGLRKTLGSYSDWSIAPDDPVEATALSEEEEEEDEEDDDVEDDYVEVVKARA